MATSSQTTFLLSAADVSWGRRECYEIDLGAVVATGLDAKYYEVDALSSDFGTNVPYYVWFDLDASSVDPAPAGRTAIEVDVVTGDTTADVAGKLVAVLEAHADFRSKLSPGETTKVLMEGEFKGAVTDVSVDVDTAFTITRNREGLGSNLGKTSGGVEVAMSTTSVQIKSDQTGEITLDEFLTGQTVEASMSLMEMTATNWKTVVGSVTGDSYTPSGGTELVGFGESRLYASLLDLGGELVLHPSRFADSDKSRDITLFKSAPKPSSVNFSGTDPQVMEVTFTALADGDVKEAIRIMAFGDASQDVRS